MTAPKGARMQQQSLYRLLAWGLIPLLGAVFTAGGAWYSLASTQGELDDLVTRFESHLVSHDTSGLDARIEEHERRLGEIDRRYEIINRNVIAICVATKAQCQ